MYAVIENNKVHALFKLEQEAKIYAHQKFNNQNLVNQVYVKIYSENQITICETGK